MKLLTYLISLLLSVTVVEAAAAAIADRVVVIKSERVLHLMKNGAPFQSFMVALGPKPRGHKVMEGDERTPEGSYILDFKNPDSAFYKSIRISYPNAADLRRAAAIGVSPGGLIMIHGLPNESTLPPSLVQTFNWTDGCIAVTNPEMELIWQSVEPGTPIDILP
jgi:murein L,D-transpeptidase YafK